MDTCGQCRHYRAISGAEITAWQGECKRYAPAPRDGGSAQWQKVVEDEVACGDFKKGGK